MFSPHSQDPSWCQKAMKPVLLYLVSMQAPIFSHNHKVLKNHAYGSKALKPKYSNEIGISDFSMHAEYVAMCGTIQNINFSEYI